MCGIAGLLAPDLGPNEGGEITHRMANTFVHRGPDDHGIWTDSGGIALAHRRLAIIDLSPNGHQPMLSASNRFAISFNGEIYNFLDLRKELEQNHGCVFKGHSDTEVLLAAIDVWGIEATLPRLNGMFAFAIWDRTHRRLTLARDRLGEKPLYYAEIRGRFYFASELSAFLVSCRNDLHIDPVALGEFVCQRAIPAPLTIVQPVRKLEPAHFLHIENGRLGQTKPYWHLPMPETQELSDSEALQQVEELLSDSVRLRMLADVPVGAFLSGGVDSSLVTALMQKQSTKKVRTYTIGFQSAAFDESEFAAAVAAHLGTEHTELTLGEREILDAVPDMARIYSEPFADSSQIPSYLVARLTRQHVTVVLSGDGGDEVFAGYDRYRTASALWHRMQKAPSWIRNSIGQSLVQADAGRLNTALGWSAALFGIQRRGRSLGEKLVKLGDLMAADQFEQFYLTLISQWQTPGQILKEPSDAPASVSQALTSWPQNASLLRKMMLTDCLRYLPDDILTKVDRATMAVSLESRIPLLDHRLLELSFRLPDRMLVRNGTRKWILKQILDRHVPRSLIERPKQGFGVPLGEWLRGPLRSWTEDLIESTPLFRADVLRERWRRHLHDNVDYSHDLWPILMFQAWAKHWRIG